MINVPINELLKKAENRYALCTVISKRARQLVDGSEPLTESKSKNPDSIATKELYEGKLTYVQTENGIK